MKTPAQIMAENAIEYDNAKRLADAALAYAKKLRCFTTLPARIDADEHLLALCDAACNVVDNGDFGTARQIILEENGWTQADGIDDQAVDEINALADYRYDQMRADQVSTGEMA